VGPVRWLVLRNPGLDGSDCCGLYRGLVSGRSLSTLHDQRAPSAASDRGSLLLAHPDNNYHGVDWLLGPLQEAVRDKEQNGASSNEERSAGIYRETSARPTIIAEAAKVPSESCSLPGLPAQCVLTELRDSLSVLRGLGRR